MTLSADRQYVRCSSGTGGEKRYGFNGQEGESEFFEEAISYNFRIEDSRLGRFLSTDPLANRFPWNSPYAFCENSVIAFLELEGLEKVNFNLYQSTERENAAIELIHSTLVRTSTYNRFVELVESSGNKDVYIEFVEFHDTSFNSDGFHNSGTAGSTTTVDRPEYEESLEKGWAFSHQYANEIDESMRSGNQVIIIRISRGFLSKISEQLDKDILEMDLDKLFNSLGDAAHTILHEANAHAINAIKNLFTGPKMEHANYNSDGQATMTSPSYEETPIEGKSPSSIDKRAVAKAINILKEAMVNLRSAAEEFESKK